MSVIEQEVGSAKFYSSRPYASPSSPCPPQVLEQDDVHRKEITSKGPLQLAEQQLAFLHPVHPQGVTVGTKVPVDSKHFHPTSCYEDYNPTTSAMVWLMYSTNIYQVTPIDICIELDTVLLGFSTYLLNLEAAELVIDQGKLAPMDEEMVQYITDYE